MARKRRAHLSTYVPTRVAEQLDDAADHHHLSLSEVINRILSKAVLEGFPTDGAAFNELYPISPDNEAYL